MLHWLHHDPTALLLYAGLSHTIAGVTGVFAVALVTRLVPGSLRRRLRRSSMPGN